MFDANNVVNTPSAAGSLQGRTYGNVDHCIPELPAEMADMD